MTCFTENMYNLPKMVKNTFKFRNVKKNKGDRRSGVVG